MFEPGRDGELFGAISQFLENGRETARCCRARDYWQLNRTISRTDLDLLRALCCGPVCAAALAARCGRDVDEVTPLLEALGTVGLVKHCAEGYRAAPAAALYLHALEHGTAAAE